MKCDIFQTTGFTLLELLIVLVLMSLLTALAAPDLARMHQNLTFSQELKTILFQLEGLGQQALQQKKEIILQSYPVTERNNIKQDAPISLPDGWRLETADLVRFLPNGVCLGGELKLHHKSQTTTFQLEPPFCRPQ